MCVGWVASGGFVVFAYMVLHLPVELESIVQKSGFIAALINVL